MPRESFAFVEYVGHLRGRGGWIGLTSLAAAILALGASLLLPRKYSATALLVIDAPAGADSRGAAAISSTYLDSLRSYEAFASGVGLFLLAAEQFQLRDSARPQPIDRLQRSVLKVRVQPGTRILAITCTLPDPRKAQAVAQYLAEQTVKLSRGVSERTDRELIAQAEQEFERARARLEQVYGPAGAASPGVPEVQRASAREGFDEAERRLADVRAAAGYRGERLSVIDPGVTPEQPSSPDVVLNVLAALLIGLVAALLYVTLEFSYSAQRSAYERDAAVPDRRE